MTDSKRKINLVVWTAIYAVIMVAIIDKWYACGTESVMAAFAFYGAISIGGCRFVDRMIQER